MEYFNYITEIAFYEKEELKGREEKAAFYTNKEVCDFMIHSLLNNKTKNEILKMKILEPSNWLWIFIFSLFDFLKKQGFDKELLIDFFINNIYTVEIDEEDNKKFLDLVSEYFNCQDKDFLDKIKKHNYNWSFFDYEEKWFDLIIGNPPYWLSMKKEKILLSKKLELGKKLSGLSNDSYGLFFLKAHSLLKEHWQISFITPNSFLNNKTFLPLRDMLLQDIETITLCPFNIFDNPFNWLKAWIKTAITTIKKNSKKDYIEIIDNQKLKYKKDFVFQIDNPIQIKKIDIKSILLKPISIFLSDKKILDILKNKKLKRVSDFFESTMWIKTANNRKFILEEKVNNDYLPFYKGTSKETQKYKSTPCWYLNLDFLKSNKSKNTNIPQDRFLNLKVKKIAIPEIWHEGKICAFDYTEWYVSSSIWIFLLKKEDKKFDIDYFLNIFNSELYEKISMVYSNWLRLEKSQIDILPIIEDLNIL